MRPASGSGSGTGAGGKVGSGGFEYIRVPPVRIKGHVVTGKHGTGTGDSNPHRGNAAVRVLDTGSQSYHAGDRGRGRGHDRISQYGKLKSVGMTPEERIFLRDFFRQVSDQPIGPGDERYIPLYDDPEMVGDDPVELMARAIEWTPGGSVQLLSGFRGTGKSTELRRLKQRLQEEDYLVFGCDIEDYLNLSVPVDISDFLIGVSGAFSDAVSVSELLPACFPHENYWDRLSEFLGKIKVEDLSVTLDTGVVSIQSNLKSDPSFKQLLQERMAGHLGALVNDVREFFETCINALKECHGNDREVVLLVDSVEHFRGTLVNAQAVQSSVESLFVSHSERLHFPHLHVVYTVPPYLKVRYSNLGSLYDPGGVHVLSALKLRNRNGTCFQEGYDAMERVVQARGDWQRLLGDRSALDRLIRYSGGHLRDLLRLLAEVLRRAGTLPVPGRYGHGSHQSAQDRIPARCRRRCEMAGRDRPDPSDGFGEHGRLA